MSLKTVLLPRLIRRFCASIPTSHVEFDVSYGLRDIVADRFDAGVRIGEQIDKDMIALPIGPRLRMAAVAVAGLLRGVSCKPQTPSDLVAHRCINLRFPTRGGLYVWDFARRGTRVERARRRSADFQHDAPYVDAALAGLGIAFCPKTNSHPSSTRPPGARPARLVSPVRRLSPVLPQPPTTIASLLIGRRRITHVKN